MLSSFVIPCIQHSYFLLTLRFQRMDHSHFFKTSHKVIVPYSLNFEVILTVHLGDLHPYVSVIRSEVVIKTVIIIIAAIIYYNIFVVIASLIGLLITGITVITIS